MSKKILIHACCALCATSTSLFFNRIPFFEKTFYFYNPNIQPLMEFIKRLEAMKTFGIQNNYKVIINKFYDLKAILKKLMNTSNRCKYCYELRLINTAKKAKELVYDAFTTTLLVSKYQQHELVKEIGLKIAREYELEFYYIDMREKFYEGLNIAKKQGLYYQKYCGCIFSEFERYYKKLEKVRL